MEFFSDPKAWVAIATLIFVAIAFKPAKKAILGAIDTRTADITRRLEEANLIKQQAEALLAKIQEQVANSKAESENIVTNAKQEATAIINEARQKLDRDIENRKKMAVQKIASYEEAALADVKSHITNLTIEVSKKLLETNINADTSKKIIDNSIEKLAKTLH
jgi:F-type H+-transporting ATPase subunit b